MAYTYRALLHILEELTQEELDKPATIYRREDMTLFSVNDTITITGAEVVDQLMLVINTRS